MRLMGSNNNKPIARFKELTVILEQRAAGIGGNFGRYYAYVVQQGADRQHRGENLLRGHKPLYTAFDADLAVREKLRSVATKVIVEEVKEDRT